MMRMTIKKSLWLLLLLVPAQISFAQDDDFGLWFEAFGNKKLFDKLELNLSGAIRTYHNTSEIEEAFLEAGLTYKFNKFLTAGASYRFTEFREDDELYHPRHKWYATVTGKLPLGDLDISAQFKFQQRFKTYFEDEDDAQHKEHLRIRLKGQYDIPSFPVNPYISYEIAIPVFNENVSGVDKSRFIAGAEYNLSKKHAIDLEYIFERDFYPKMSDISIISLNYKFEF